jgi:multidrug efflux system outer membrane protein
MAPKYSQPAAPVPAAWPNGPAYQAEVGTPQVKTKTKSIADIPWREYFVDPNLQKVVDLALQNNRDLRVATLNIERFEALYQIRRADIFPKVDASATADFQRISADISSTGKSITRDQYAVGLGVSSYELDLFGRVRSLKDQALEQYLATEQAQRSVRISLISQVAAAYLALAADRERLQLAKDTLANQQEGFQITKSRYNAGVSSALDLNQAQTTVDAALVDISRYTATVAQSENALNQLVGSPVPAELLPQTLTETLASVADVPAGTPSDVLLKRPDILQAEGDLKAANANIGAAQAAFFPRITLVSSVGFSSDQLTGLFQGNSFAWSFIPRISLPIFDGGTNKANLTVSEVDRNIALARYEKAIQNAFREVADALAKRGTISGQLAAQQSLADASEASFKLSQARFDKGVDNYLNVLIFQRYYYGAQQNLINVRLERLNNQVTLYKALGGSAL